MATQLLAEFPELSYLSQVISSRILFTIFTVNIGDKILKTCSLPLTGAKAVSTVVTELAAFDVDRVNGELELIDLAEGVTVDEVRAKTDADFKVRSHLGSFA